ncbi:MAG: squalene synthase HpnC [Planctomycetia bacterium]|nr:squalene synthase HpnC [Planctomycetia bacterium]
MSGSAFADELSRWGPDAVRDQGPSLAEAQAYCRRLATTHYENFPVVSWLLPRSLHQHFYNIYAYCRWADDLGDEVGNTARALELLGWWRGELSACYAGQVRHPVFTALAPTIREFGIPTGPFEDLISAFEQDQTVPTYETFDQLVDYCRRSANPVGRLVLYLCRQATLANFGWSDSICTGLQLANFWQDVARDLDIGRIYLPQEDLRRFGYTLEDLQARITNQAFLDLMAFEVDRARRLLSPWNDPGLPELAPFPLRVQVDIELFARGGERILDRIAGIGYRVWAKRPVVTKGDVAKLFAGCLWRAILRTLRRPAQKGSDGGSGGGR